jgi:8-oxo-dGTP pyrophosphatase MutT (NUDIX family)
MEFSKKTLRTQREQRIRPVAICICLDRGRILVAEYREKERLYYRPLGGTIEFGESGEQTIQREFREEIETGLKDVRFLGALENIYTLGKLRGHEIVLVFDGRLCDESLYEKNSLEGDELGQPFKAVWIQIKNIRATGHPVYPDGLLALLEKQTRSPAG